MTSGLNTSDSNRFWLRWTRFKLSTIPFFWEGGFPCDWQKLREICVGKLDNAFAVVARSYTEDKSGVDLNDNVLFSSKNCSLPSDLRRQPQKQKKIRKNATLRFSSVRRIAPFRFFQRAITVNRCHWRELRKSVNIVTLRNCHCSSSRIPVDLREKNYDALHLWPLEGLKWKRQSLHPLEINPKTCPFPRPNLDKKGNNKPFFSSKLWPSRLSTALCAITEV